MRSLPQCASVIWAEVCTRLVQLSSRERARTQWPLAFCCWGCGVRGKLCIDRMRFEWMRRNEMLKLEAKRCGSVEARWRFMVTNNFFNIRCYSLSRKFNEEAAGVESGWVSWQDRWLASSEWTRFGPRPRENRISCSHRSITPCTTTIATSCEPLRSSHFFYLRGRKNIFLRSLQLATFDNVNNCGLNVEENMCEVLVASEKKRFFGVPSKHWGDLWNASGYSCCQIIEILYIFWLFL